MSPRSKKGHGSDDKDPDLRKLAEELREAAQTPEWQSMDAAADAFRQRQQGGES